MVSLQGFGGRYEERLRIDEHNSSIVGGNWEGIIGDGLNRGA